MFAKYFLHVLFLIVTQSFGEIDAYRIQYRQQRKIMMGHIIRQGLHGKAAEICIEEYCQKEGIEDIEKFTAMTLTDLSMLHAGAIIGLGVTEKQFETCLVDKP